MSQVPQQTEGWVGGKMWAESWWNLSGNWQDDCKELAPLSIEATKSGELIFSMSGSQELNLMSEVAALIAYVRVTNVLVFLLREGC